MQEFTFAEVPAAPAVQSKATSGGLVGGIVVPSVKPAPSHPAVREHASLEDEEEGDEEKKEEEEEEAAGGGEAAEEMDVFLASTAGTADTESLVATLPADCSSYATDTDTCPTAASAGEAALADDDKMQTDDAAAEPAVVADASSSSTGAADGVPSAAEGAAPSGQPILVDESEESEEEAPGVCVCVCRCVCVCVCRCVALCGCSTRPNACRVIRTSACLNHFGI
jgi:hypothetical protein